MTLPYRERALAQFARNFANVPLAAPTDDPYEITWASVGRTPLTDRERGKVTAVAILDTDETKIQRVGFMECSLRIAIEFYFPVAAGEEPSTKANIVLSEIQRIIRHDIYLREDVTNENLVLNLVEAGNNLDVDKFNVRRVEGTVFVNMLYRHAPNDPRQYVGQA